MDFFFEPKGIAVVGATPERYHGGRHLVANLTFGYKGPIYPVNPKYNEVLGLKCYPKVSDIEGPLDLALIFIPAQAVPQPQGRNPCGPDRAHGQNRTRHPRGQRRG